MTHYFIVEWDFMDRYGDSDAPHHREKRALTLEDASEIRLDLVTMESYEDYISNVHVYERTEECLDSLFRKE